MNVNLVQLSLALSRCVDMSNDDFINHHLRTAYFSEKIGEYLGLPDTDMIELVVAAMLHDIGVLSQDDLTAIIDQNETKIHGHARRGAALLGIYEPFRDVAQIILHHHTNAEDLFQQGLNQRLGLLSNILFLADSLERKISNKITLNNVLDYKDDFIRYVSGRVGRYYLPDVAGAFIHCAQSEVFWFEAMMTCANRKSKYTNVSPWICSLEDDRGIVELFSNLIDLRSHFTATHSAGVACTSRGLAELIGLGYEACEAINLAANLHDLGKLSVPLALINKPGKLTDSEFNTIKLHPFYTQKVLSSIQGMEEVAIWAGTHHERLDGSGYPFGLRGEAIPIQSRIIAVSDIFVAMSERRPYREPLDKPRAMQELTHAARNGQIDPVISGLLLDNYDAFSFTLNMNTYRAHKRLSQAMEDCGPPQLWAAYGG